MKKLTSYNRAAGYLNRIFDLLNEEYFENELTRPVITIQSTPRAYGHFSLRDDTWVSVTGNSHEINIGAGTLARPIEEVVTTMLHEMIHYSLLFRVGGYEGISEYGYITRPFTVKDMDRIRAKAKEYPKCLSNNIPECPLEIADDFVLPF